jgi:predicted O-methyltransferase YrrM
MKSWINTPRVTGLLESLYADAAANAHRPPGTQPPPAGSREFFHRMRKAYMAIGPEFGRLLYSQARVARARTIVEFGTSFGISTIYLAAALRDNGGGRVVTTEYEEEKAARAQKNLAAAGLSDYVEFRVGDALQTLANFPHEIDMIFLDGAKELYLDVLQLLEGRLRAGGVVASDNADHDGLEAFLDYLRNPDNGYTSAAIFTEGRLGKAHEISVRN